MHASVDLGTQMATQLQPNRIIGGNRGPVWRLALRKVGADVAGLDERDADALRADLVVQAFQKSPQAVFAGCIEGLARRGDPASQRPDGQNAAAAPAKRGQRGADRVDCTPKVGIQDGRGATFWKLFCWGGHLNASVADDRIDAPILLEDGCNGTLHGLRVRHIHRNGGHSICG